MRTSRLTTAWIRTRCKEITRCGRMTTGDLSLGCASVKFRRRPLPRAGLAARVQSLAQPCPRGHGCCTVAVTKGTIVSLGNRGAARLKAQRSALKAQTMLRIHGLRMQVCPSQLSQLQNLVVGLIPRALKRSTFRLSHGKTIQKYSKSNSDIVRGLKQLKP